MKRTTLLFTILFFQLIRLDAQEWMWISPSQASTDFYSINIFDGDLRIAGKGGMIVKGNFENEFTYNLISENEGTIIKDLEFISENVGFALLERIHPYYKSKIMKTIDSGETWYSVFEDLVGEPRSIEFIDNMVGFVGTNGGHIYKSSDSGENWVFDQTLSSIHDIEFLDDKTGFIAARSYIYKTTDSGNTWTGYNHQNSVPYYGVEILDSNNGWVNGFNGIYKTENGGISWSFTEIDDNVRFEDVKFFDAQNGIAIGTVTNSLPQIFTTSNGGSTWVKVESSSLQRGTINALEINDQGKAWVVGHAGVIYFSNDFGLSWSNLNSDLLNETSFFSNVKFRNENKGAIVGGNTILITEDGGKNWTEKDQSGSNSIIYTELSWATDDLVYVCYSVDEILKLNTVTGEQTSISIPRFNGSCAEIFFSNQNEGFVISSNGGIAVTTDGGNSWTINEINLANFQGAISSYAQNSSTVWLIGVGEVVKTDDLGSTWTRYALPAEMYPEEIIVDEQTNIWLLSNSTIWKSVNGESWTEVQISDKEGEYRSIFNDPQNGNIYLTKNYYNNGNSLYISTDKGDTWVKENIPIFDESNFIITKSSSEEIWLVNGKYVLKYAPDQKLTKSEQELSRVESYNQIQNYPNPFNPSTNIYYKLERAGNISLDLYDIAGRLIYNLESGYKTSGQHSFNFSANGLSSGVYIYTITTSEGVFSNKMTLIK